MAMDAKNIKHITEYISTKLDARRFGEPYETLLVETFVRMYMVLDLSIEELNEDINNFNNSVRQFRFDKMAPNTMGYFSPSNNEIVFNIDYWQNLMNTCSEKEYTIKFFETFAHECLHGMQNIVDKRGNSYNRAGGYNKRTDNRSHAIYEICTQATAAKCARNINLSDFLQGRIISGDGYSDEIFAVPLMATTFGVSEQDILKYGMRDRKSLITVLNKHIGDYAYTEELLKKIEDELEIIHSISYPDDSQSKFINMPEDQKKKMKTDSIIKLTEFCQSAFSKRISDIPLDIDDNSIRALKNDQEKMLQTLRNEFDYYGYGLSVDYNRMFFLTTDFSMEARYIRKSLNVLSDIVKDKEGRFTDDRIDIVNCVKKGDFDELERHGIISEREVTMFLPNHSVGMKEKRIHIDYKSLEEEWDNSNIQNAIYYRDRDTDEIPVVLYLKNWTESRLESTEGKRKLQVLQKAARLTSKTHDGKDIRFLLFKYINAKTNEISNFASGVTRNGNAREDLTREFSTIEDKEYLLKLIAQRYLDKIYDSNYKMPKTIQNETELEARVRLCVLPTIERYGKEHAMWALTRCVLEGQYDSISNQNGRGRDNLKLVVPQSFLDVISKPLMDELMQKRTIPDHIKNAMDYALLRTEQKYPGTLDLRIANFINRFISNGVFNYNEFTSDGRNGLINTITSKEDLENMIGYIANNFSSKAEAEQYKRDGNNSANRYYRDLAVQMGTDAFREAMIKAIVDRDFSGFSPEVATYFTTIDNSIMIRSILSPTVEKEFQMSRVLEQNNAVNNINRPTRADLRQNAREQKLSIIDKFLIKLKKVFGGKNRNKNSQEYFENNER